MESDELEWWTRTALDGPRLIGMERDELECWTGKIWNVPTIWTVGFDVERDEM